MACLAAIDADMTVDKSTEQLSADIIADALVKFGDEADGDKVLLIAPAQMAALRKSESWLKATDMGVFRFDERYRRYDPRLSGRPFQQDQTRGRRL